MLIPLEFSNVCQFSGFGFWRFAHKYSGHAMWFGPVLGWHVWQLSRLAWKHKNVNAIYIGRNQNSIAWVKVGPWDLPFSFFNQPSFSSHPWCQRLFFIELTESRKYMRRSGNLNSHFVSLSSKNSFGAICKSFEGEGFSFITTKSKIFPQFPTVLNTYL